MWVRIEYRNSGSSVWVWIVKESRVEDVRNFLRSRNYIIMKETRQNHAELWSYSYGH